MIIKNLLETNLFKGCNYENIKSIINENYINIKKYKKNSIIVHEYEECVHISIIIKGSLYINQLLENGDTLRIRLYKENDAFECALFGSNNKNYPFSLISYEDTEIIHIPFNQINSLLIGDKIFMMNFIKMLSNNITSLKDKIKILSLKSIRDKLLYYLSKNTKNGITHMNHTKTEISKILGIARGSISRELKKMEQENIIQFIDKKTLKILTNNLNI